MGARRHHGVLWRSSTIMTEPSRNLGMIGGTLVLAIIVLGITGLLEAE